MYTKTISLQTNLQSCAWSKKRVKSRVRQWSLETDLTLLFDNLDTGVEASKIFHSFFLNLNWTNGGWCINFGLEPTVHPSCFGWGALASCYSESSSFSLWTTGEGLFLYLLRSNILSRTLTIVTKQLTQKKYQNALKVCISLYALQDHRG